MNRISRIVLLVAFAAPAVGFAQTTATKSITLEDIWTKGTFRSEGVFGIRSMNSGTQYTAFDVTNTGTALKKYDYATGKETGTVFKSADLKPTGSDKAIEVEDYTFSPDETKILISTETEHIYRYSTREENYVLDLKTNKLSRLSTGGKQRLATFSPDGKKVAFVRDNNLFLVDLSSNTESQITTDGLWNHIINGGTDWVYEEEFTLPNGIFWSPDSKHLAFYRFDESAVKEFSMTMYENNLYPSQYSYKYPKAGETNSIVSIYVYDLASKTSKHVDVGDEKDQYIPRIQWTQDANKLCVTRMNRLQNKLELLMADATTGSTSVFFTETSDTYIEIYDHLTFMPDKKSFLWSSDMDGHQHFYLYDMNGQKIRQITSGDWDIIDFKGMDAKTQTLYYISNEESAIKRALYSIKIDGTGKKKLSQRSGSNAADFSTGMKYYINTFSDANTPNLITLHDASGKQIKVLKDNAKLNATIKEYGFTKKEFFTFTNSSGTSLNGWMMKPANFDATKKYPVYMYVYGGPGHNTVVDSWGSSDYCWHQFLTQHGYIVVSVDNRGTEYRGKAFKKCTYGQMGKLETEDQIDAANYLKSQSYVDGSRIGMQGWSYGGYMSALCITKGASVFKTGISVAPVSNWRYYDSIYTERYMGLPQKNASGYDDNSPINHMSKLTGKFLLIHGTADDNVHFQNSVELIDALQKANKQFDLMVYPDKNHSIFGGTSRLNLYTKVWNFTQANL